VNAAGLGSDRIDRIAGHDRFTITPRRGQLIVFDKLARPMVDVIVLPVPSSLGKGVLISPTVFGNVMLGPTAEDLVDRTDTATTREGLDFLRAKGAVIMPALLEEEVTAMYAGLRAASDQPDLTIEATPDQRYVVAGGIRSTGLTASMAIAEHVRSLIGDVVTLGDRSDLPETVRMPNIGEAFVRPYANPDLIASDPAYGEIVCFCERVTRGEIRDALSSAIPPSDVEGLRRRTRAQLGRCQGFFCGAEVQAMLEGCRPD
jgi:glycerol-3-phosphate dehydrogenase